MAKSQVISPSHSMVKTAENFNEGTKDDLVLIDNSPTK